MQIYKNQRGKVIGVASAGIFSKKVKRSKHLLRKWDAYGIDKSILDELVSNGVQKVLIYETEDNKEYLTTVKEFAERGIEADFGHSPQIFLPLVYFNKDKVN